MMPEERSLLRQMSTPKFHIAEKGESDRYSHKEIFNPYLRKDDAGGAQFAPANEHPKVSHR